MLPESLTVEKCDFLKPTSHFQIISYIIMCWFISSEYTDFLEDLEEDPQIRENVNIYKGNPLYTSSVNSDTPNTHIEVYCLY